MILAYVYWTVLYKLSIPSDDATSDRQVAAALVLVSRRTLAEAMSPREIFHASGCC